MNKAHRELIEKRYIEAVNEYVQAFCDRHGYGKPEGWVGDRVGEILIVNDMFVDFADIKIDIDHNVPEEMFEQWYYYTLRLHELGCDKTINYWSFSLGAPLPYTEEQLAAIEVAAKRKDEAEQALKDCLAAASESHDFIDGDSCCGNCRQSAPQTDGNYCRCRLHKVFRKYNDPACKDWLKGGNE